MTTYLTSAHALAPEWVVVDGQAVPTEPLIAADEAAILATLGLYPHVHPVEPTPLGVDWVLSAGVYVGAPAGSAAEIAAALAEQAAAELATQRAEMTIDRWQGRMYLASLPAATEGALAQLPGSTLLAQIDAFVEASMAPAQIERYRGTATWRRTDPMIAQMQTLLGLTDAQVDDWFTTAGEFR